MTPSKSLYQLSGTSGIALSEAHSQYVAYTSILCDFVTDHRFVDLKLTSNSNSYLDEANDIVTKVMTNTNACSEDYDVHVCWYTHRLIQGRYPQRRSYN